MNPDIYLLYEYMEKVPYTVRIKVCLDAVIDEALLAEAAQEAIDRLPYFSVKVDLDEGQNYVLHHNDKPIDVIPEKDERLTLGSEAVNGHLFVITYRDNCIWFNFSHAPCGATGGLFWVKTTLYQYMTKKYGHIEPPKDIKLAGTPVTDGELFFPDADKLPDDEPIARYAGGDSNLQLGRFLKYLFNPFARDNYYYQIDIPVRDFMAYAARIDGSPNTILTAIMFKVCSGLFKEKKGMFELARQFAAADQIVIAAPYWDLSFPAALKQYFEQINVLGITFIYTPEGIPKGLCRARKLYYVTTAGGNYVPWEYGYGYVKALAEAYYGIPQTELIQATGLDIDGADAEGILVEAMNRI